MPINITVTAVVYNEEARIENFLKSFSWSNDIIIVDKSSTDRTREISKAYGANVIKVPYSDTGGELAFAVDAAKNEWLMSLTASDMIHPSLADKMLELVNQKDFDYDIIALPFAAYTLGICHKRSPWFLPRKNWLFKKTVFSRCDKVHQEAKGLSSKKIYKMPKDTIVSLYHFSHQDLDSFFERHLRYTKAEAANYKTKNKALLKISGEIYIAILWMIFYKKTWLLGWKGMALFYAFLSYFIMKFLYVWEKFEGKGAEKYIEIQKNLLKASASKNKKENS